MSYGHRTLILLWMTPATAKSWAERAKSQKSLAFPHYVKIIR